MSGGWRPRRPSYTNPYASPEDNSASADESPPRTPGTARRTAAPEPECGLTELPVSMCAHCREQDLPEPEPMHWFAAQYHGRCADCATPIEPGDEIAATEDGYVCRRHR